MNTSLKRDTLWAKVLRAKYLATGQLTWNAQHRGSSYLWKVLYKLVRSLEVYIGERWEMEDGLAFGLIHVYMIFHSQIWLREALLGTSGEPKSKITGWIQGAETRILWERSYLVKLYKNYNK